MTNLSTPTMRKNSRLLIVAPMSDVYSGVGNFGAPPLGPWRLAFWLRKHGQVADVWDCNVSENLRIPSLEEQGSRNRAEVLAEAFVTAMEADYDLASYEWIGLSLLNDTLVIALSCIELLRVKYPQAKLIGGNHEATVNLQDCLGKSKLNGVILADAEESMLRLMRGEEPSKVPGVVWRNFNPKPSRENFEAWNDEIRWDQIPYRAYWEKTSALYDWDAMTEEERLQKRYEVHCVRVHSLVSCELPCLFCTVSQTRRIASGSNKPSIINLSPGALERNLLAIKAQVPDVMTIYDSCDEAFLGKGRALEYCRVLEKVKPVMDVGLPRGMRYLIQCRTNDLDEEIIDFCSRVGVRHLTIGVESPIEQVRRDMMKPQKEEHVRNVIRWMASRDVTPYLLFIGFYPTVTLEQLYEGVENWRAYMALGATISIEPFCMAYASAQIADDPTLLTEYVGYDIPFSGTPPKRVKWASLIWPKDERVCAVLSWVRENLDDFIAAERRKVSHKHAWKGFIGKIIVDCIEHALNLYQTGKLSHGSTGGRRSMVYQDYGDQASGAEVAAAAVEGRLDRRTTTRFNSTHSLLDAKLSDPNAGVKGRIKDPALPHEFPASASDESTDEDFQRRKMEAKLTERALSTHDREGSS